MTLKLNGSSSGSVSIDAPASTTGGADVTLTLPENGFGKLLNVVTASNGTVNQSPSANDTWTDVAPTATITPSADSSKIIIIASTGILGKFNYHGGVKLLRGSTGLMEWWNYTSDASEWMPMNNSFFYIDSPNTTSATTYKFQIYADNNNANMFWNYNGTPSTALTKSEVYLLELGA